MVAASIDQTLSMEAGRMVPRTAWAGAPPDGVMDSLLSWLPSVKSKKRLYERGQQLWVEQMTMALSGPCQDCLGRGNALAPGATLVQMPGADAATQFPGAEPAGSQAKTAFLSTPPAQDAGSPYDAGSAYDPGSTYDPGSSFEEGRTSVIPSYLPSNSASGAPAADAPTTANPPFGSGYGMPPIPQAPSGPEQGANEHESHTVILSALPSLRTPTRLVVVDGPVHGRQFSLGRAATTIGRSIGSHVTVESDAVAYDHARIVRSGNDWTLEVAPGAAELYVNEEPVHGSRLLRNRDVIRVGPARLRFESAT
ncbi:MAG: FHA domain-containing protein [Chloroflexota bacterium]